MDNLNCRTKLELGKILRGCKKILEDGYIGKGLGGERAKMIVTV